MAKLKQSVRGLRALRADRDGEAPQRNICAMYRIRKRSDDDLQILWMFTIQGSGGDDARVPRQPGSHKNMRGRKQ